MKPKESRIARQEDGEGRAHGTQSLTLQIRGRHKRKQSETCTHVGAAILRAVCSRTLIDEGTTAMSDAER